MPFTASHAAAALLFTRTPLVPAALVIGTMTPDLPYFTPLPGSLRDLTHVPLGIVTIDLLIGGVVLALWWFVLRAPVIDLSPAWLRERMPARAIPAGAAGLALIAVSLALGVSTHLAWDVFTHPGPVVDALPLLNTQVGPLVVHKWLQHGSSVVGLALLGVWAWRWVGRTERQDRAAVAGASTRRAFWIGVASTFAIVAGYVWGVGILLGYEPFDPSLVFLIARVSIGAALVVAGGCCAWWFLAEPSRASDRAHNGNDLAEKRRVVAQNRSKCAVARQEPRVAVALLEDLDRGLLVEHGRDDIAVLRVLLLTHDDPVAVADRCVDHRVPDDLEHE